jgi:glycosyltransferase involved in cell wall biosynthesis
MSLNNKVEISFIIPLHNGEKFLRRCFDSLLSQNIDTNLFEIVCVDDASTDETVEIVNNYILSHENIKLIQHPINLKTGSSCNTGLGNAAGNFVWIIGQDDWIEENCLGRLLQQCLEKKLDVLLFNYNRVDENGKKLDSVVVFNNEEVQRGDDFINRNFKETFPQYLLGYEWRAIFRREFLVSNKIYFTEGAIYEDTTYLFKAILFSHRMMSVPDFIYNYRVNQHSITDINKRYNGSLIYEFAFVAGKEVSDLSNEIENRYYDISKILAHTANWYFKSFTYKILPAPHAEKKVFYKKIKLNHSEIKKLIVKSPEYVKILADPIYGLVISTFLKPLYIIKSRAKGFFVPKQEWSK